MAQQDPTVHIIDDDADVRRMVQTFVESAGLKASAYASAEEFLRTFDPAAPGCIILDICMPGMSGLDLQEKLAAQSAALPIIMISGQADVPMAVQAMRTGAIDVIGKPFSGQALVDRGREALARDAEQRRLSGERADTLSRVARLTPREREVLELIVAGKHTKAIAADLSLSPKTVESYRASLMIKMGAENVADLVRRYVAAGVSNSSES